MYPENHLNWNHFSIETYGDLGIHRGSTMFEKPPGASWHYVRIQPTQRRSYCQCPGHLFWLGPGVRFAVPTVASDDDGSGLSMVINGYYRMVVYGYQWLLNNGC